MLRHRIYSVLLLALLSAGCTTLTDMKTDLSERVFGRAPMDPPAELTEIKPTLTPKIMWKTSLGKSNDYDFSPATENGAVYAASANGQLIKVNAETGKAEWEINTGEALSGGVGLGPNLVLVGTAQGYVVAYDQSGKLLWKSKVSSEVLSSPKFDSDIIVVRCGDSRIFGLNATDGKRKWVYERTTPALSLRSSAGVVVSNSMAYAGFAGGKLVALRVEDGKIAWEATVAQPRGTTEIERIADITSTPVIDGSVIYAVAYQGKVSVIDRASGRIGWSRDISSYTGLNAEDGRVYVSHATGSVYALDYTSGKTFWRQGDLANRLLTAPLPMGSVVAIGDVQGYVHFLDRDEGTFAARIQTDESQVMPQMTALGSSGLLVQTRSGGLYAINVK